MRFAVIKRKQQEITPHREGGRRAGSGHPSDLDNLQLAHWTCNRQKSDRLLANAGGVIESNRNLPQSMDWAAYRA